MPLHRSGANSPLPQTSVARAQLSLLTSLSPQPVRCAVRGHEPSASWAVKSSSGEGRLFPGGGQARPSHLPKGGGGWGGRGASSSSPGLAVLYGFLFLCDSTAHSYRDWSRGARRGRPAEGADTERGAVGGPRRAGTAAHLSSAQAAGDPPLLLSSPLAEGIVGPHHCSDPPSKADPHNKAGTRNRTVSS